MKGEKSIKKLILIIFSFCFILLCLTGCSLTKGKSLLEAPVFENEEYEIYNTLKNSIYSNSSLFLDIPENKKSAVTFLNNKNSAVLFYNTKEKSNLKMALLNKTNSNWKYVLEVPLGNVKLLDVLIAKNKEENSEFLIVGTKKNKEKIYTIFNVEGKSINKLFSNTYNYMTLFDKQNGEDKTLIVLVDCVSLPKMKENENIELTEKIKKLIDNHENSLKKYEKEFNTPQIEHILNETIFLFISLEKNKIKVTDYHDGISKSGFDIENFYFDEFNTKTFNLPALFLSFSYKDFISPKSPMTLFFKKNKFYSINFGGSGNISIPPFIDIDKNKKLKILKCLNLPGYQGEDENTPSNYIFSNTPMPCENELTDIHIDNLKESDKIPGTTNSYSINGRDLFNKMSTYINHNHKYGIKFPKNWKFGSISAKYINENQDIDFFLWKGSLEKDSQKILSISVDYASKENKKNNDFFVLAKRDNLIYYANVYENLKIDKPECKLTRKQLKDLFFTID